VPGHAAGPVAASGASKILARAWASSSCVNAPNSLWWRSSSFDQQSVPDLARDGFGHVPGDVIRDLLQRGDLFAG